MAPSAYVGNFYAFSNQQPLVPVVSAARGALLG